MTHRVALNGLRIVLGLAVGVGCAELAFRQRDNGAFPHVNLYEADAELGVRLRPRSSMRLQFGGNPVTTVRVNSEGFRGADWPAPAGDEVLVVGDSQVFGLGVEEGETAAARLESRLGGARVINGGVPTYGPLEYERVIERMLASRKPKRVVYVVNLSNDLFEAGRPNRERHAVWDGWAVRKETAPSSIASFPGREALFRTSHAVYALRRWWYRENEPTEALSTPSTGTFRDISSAAARAADEHLRARQETKRLDELAASRRSTAKGMQRQAADEFLTLVERQGLGVNLKLVDMNRGATQNWDPLKASFASAGDIVGSEDYAEWSSPIAATAEMILQGAEIRKTIEKALRTRAAADAGAAARIEPVLARVAASQQLADKLEAEPPEVIRAWSPLAPSIRRAKALCDAAGARLLVAVLPLDVQVSDTEWRKYGAEPVDLAPARVLVDDVIAAAEDVAADVVELTDALRKAEPGAFVDRDPHLSPKGQDAVAAALAEALARPPVRKLPSPRPGPPPGRTPPTALALVKSLREVTVPGSSAAGCETYIVDEWLTLRCHDKGVDHALPVGVHVVAAPLGEAAIYRDGGPDAPLVVQVPVLKAQSTIVDFRWPSRSRRLDATWSGSRVTVAFHGLPADAPSIPDPPAPGEAACACEREVTGKEACGQLPLLDNPACSTTYRGECASILSCLRGERAAPPACPFGTGPVGVFQRCLPLCSKEQPCAGGTCTAYQGAEVCL
jgi:hypothetical protein